MTEGVSIGDKLIEFGHYLNTEDPLIMSWEDIIKFVNFILIAGNVKVTDEVYEKMYGLKWSGLRYYLHQLSIKKERYAVSPYGEVINRLPKDKYQLKTT